MKLAERLAALDRTQRTRLFKIIASAVVAAASVVGLVSYVVAINAREGPVAMAPAPETEVPAAEGEAPAERSKSEAELEQERAVAAQRSAIDESARAIERVLAGRKDPTSVAFGVVVVLGLALGVVWLGLGLTYLGLLLAGGVFAGLMLVLPGLRGLAPMVFGLTVLAAAFTALMRLASVLLSAPGATFAIARNVLAEAVRMKVSLVFIVMLMLLLAALPLLLDSESPLRYRVQAFLQYGTGGAFWLIAILTIVFAVGTVAFEQRDKVIWQTMTKPVTAAQYVFGKWLGVVTLGAVLLSVSGTAVFLFTEYLRSRPALGESSAYVTPSGIISEDRLILETQVLAARVGAEADPPALDPEAFEKAVIDRIEREKVNEFFQDTPERRAQIRAQMLEETATAFRSIEPGQGQRYTFSGFGEAKRIGAPLTFRMRINAGSNRPDMLYRITLVISGSEPIVREMTLDNTHQMQLSPAAISDDGLVSVEVYNGDAFTGAVNEMSILLPPKDGLHLSYPAGGYRANFVRVMIVLWIKLALMAMIAVWAATFLSFPVASLVAFGLFILAEGAGYLSTAAENFSTIDLKGNTIFWRLWIERFTSGVVWFFRTYADLRPTGKLVDGIRMNWSGVGAGAGVLLLWTLVLFVTAVLIFRRRELATYSGR